MKTKILFLILLTAPLGLSAKVAEATASAGASIDSISPNPDSKYESGKNFLHGRGVEKNPEKAIEHFKKAADLGHIEALGAIGYFYSVGLVVDMNDVKAAECFQKDSEKRIRSCQ